MVVFFVDGVHVLSATATNSVGATTRATQVTVTVGNAPSGVGNVSPANGATGVPLTPTLTAATATDPTAPVSYSFELYAGNACNGAPARAQ